MAKDGITYNHERTVKADSKSKWAGKKGYYQFSTANGGAVLTEEPVKDNDQSGKYFVVDRSELEPLFKAPTPEELLEEELKK